MTKHNSQAIIIGGGIALVVLVAFVLGYSLRGSTQQSNQPQTSQRSMMSNMNEGMMDHGAMVNSEADFIMEMIPHHQEAIDTSNYMLTRTDDPEFKQFLQSIVVSQTIEVAKMKEWHQLWFNEPYKDDGRYEAMMPNLEQADDNDEARQQYLMGMIMHHTGAVQMASKVKTITTREELLAFADQIITVQNKEIEQMRSWMMESRENGAGMMDHMMH